MAGVQSRDYGQPGSVSQPMESNAVEQASDRSSKQAVAQEAAAKGAAVYEFDPEADPQAKAAALLRQAKDQVAPLSRPNNTGTALATDVNSTGKAPTPTLTLDDVKETSDQAANAPSTGVPEGKLSNGKVANIAEDAQIGWSGQKHIRDAQAAGDKITEVAEPPPRVEVVAQLLSDVYYGTQWHNAAIIFFAIGASHYLTRFGGGLFSLVFVGMICATYYSTSIQRVRHRARDDIQRELAKTRLYTEHESADWINNFLRRFWLAYEPLLSATIVMAVDQVLSESCPAFLESLRMTTFTLGTKGPRIDFVRTFPDTEDDVVVMDLKISFTPNDIQDLTPRQVMGKVNPKIVLAIRLGKGIASVGKDILTEDIAFTGVMRVKLKLMSNFPNIKTVEMSFLEKPVIDFVLKPIGFDINMIPGLANFIDSQIHANLGPMMYSPNSFALDLEQLLSGAPIDTAIGVVQITLFNARGLKGVKIGGGTPDPFVSVSIAQRAELAKTKVKHSTVNPHWNETKYILVNSLNDVLSLSVKDWNEHRKDSELGIANFDLKSLEADPEQEHVQTTVTHQGKDRGVLNFAITYYPALVPKKLEGGVEEAVPDSMSGIARLTIHQGKELDHKKSVSHSQLNPYARLFLQNAPIYSTRTLKRTTAPAWESSTEFLVTNKPSAVIGVKVIDERGLSVDPTLGYLNVKLTDLLEAKAQGKDWFPLSGCASGRVRMSAEWKSVVMAGAINGARSYRPPIGVIRFWLKRATDLKNVEALTGGKSDPYVRILLGGITQARTEIVNNNLSPEWDEIVYVPVHNLKEKLVLEVMDYEHTSKDRSLGSLEVNVANYVTEGSSSTEKWISNGKKECNDGLRIDGKRTLKGTLFYEACFYPCTNIGNISFDPPPSPLEKVKADDQSDTASTVNTAAMGGHEVEQTDDFDFEEDAQRIASNTAASKPAIEKLHQTGASVTSLASIKTSKSKEDLSIPRETLLQTQSGILVYNIVGGRIARKGARLEVLFDSGYWPAYTTEKARSVNSTWDEVHETFIKELDFSRIIFKLNEAEKETTDETYAELSLDMNEFLETALDKPTEFCLSDNRGLSKSYITVCAKYIPVPITIEPRESVNNTGLLRVDLLSATGLRSADRGGSSDPYAVFELAGEKIFKSAVVKKSLKPVWNETFECPVPSRATARFWLKVYDWDAVGTPDKLGQVQIDLSQLEPFTATPLTLPLSGTGEHKGQGEVSVRLVFRPEFITRVRAATSGTMGRVGTGLGTGVGTIGKGVGTVGKGGVRVVSGVGHGVGHGGKAVGKGVFGLAYRATHGGHSRESSAVATTEEEEFMAAGLRAGHTASAPVMDPTTGTLSTPTKSAVASNGRSNGYSTNSTASPTLEGTLKVTITGVHVEGAEKTSVVVKQNGKILDKTHPSRTNSESQFGDTFVAKTTAEASVIEFAVLEKKTFGKDKPIATAEISVWDYLSPSLGTTSASPAIPLSPDGSLQIQLDWKAHTEGDRQAGSPASVRTNRTGRFSKLLHTPEKSSS